MDSKSQLIYRAAYLNDKGYSLMEKGKQHEAFETFVMALDSLAALEQQLSAEESTCRYCDRTFSCLPSSRNRRRRSAATIQHPSTQNTQSVFFNLPTSSSLLVLCDEHDNFQDTLTLDTRAWNDDTNNSSNLFIYNRSFRFLPGEHHFFLDSYYPDETTKTTTTSSIQYHYINFYKAIITFNSALSFHQRSRDASPKIQETAESVACDLYLDAMTLLQDCFATLDTSRVLAALLNNAAILLYEMHDYERMEWVQAELHHLLVDIEHNDANKKSKSKAIDPRCLQCFFFNATLLAPPGAASAA